MSARKFDCVENLLLALEADRDPGSAPIEHNRYPTRFILVQSVASWNELIRILLSRVELTFRISDHCKGELLPSIEELPLKVLELMGPKRTVVVPLLEVIRWRNSKIGPILREFAELQTKVEWRSQQRLYIPLLMPFEDFERILGALPRYHDNLLPTVYCLKDHPDFQMTMTCRALPDLPICRGFQDYLIRWEQGQVPSGNWQTISSLVARLDGDAPDNGFHLIRTDDEYLHERLHISTGAQEPTISEVYGTWLAQQLEPEDMELADVVLRLCDLRLDSPQKLMRVLLRNDTAPELQWWIWIHLRAKGLPESDLLGYVLRNAKSPMDIPTLLVTSAMEIELDSAALERRRELLSEVPSIMDQYLAHFEKIENPLTRLQLMTAFSPKQRTSVLRIVAEAFEKNVSKTKLLSLLSDIYPEPAWYLNVPSGIALPISDYLQCYVQARLLDTPTDTFISQDELIHHGIREDLWKCPTRNEALENVSDSSQYWCDGLGAEWAGFIEGFAQANDLDCQLVLARANLPTSTAANREWPESVAPSRDLDKLAHAPGYPHPERLGAMLDAVKKVLIEIAKDLQSAPSGENRFLTGDHGFTASSLNRFVFECPEGFDVNDNRRSVLSTRPEVTYPKWLEQHGDSGVLAYHGRIRGQGGIQGCLHGGATLEEWLVPVARLRRGQGRVSLPALRDYTSIIQLDTAGKGVLSVELSCPARKVSLLLAGKELDGVVLDGLHYQFSLEGLSSGSYAFTLHADEHMAGEGKITLRRGLAVDDLGL